MFLSIKTSTEFENWYLSYKFQILISSFINYFPEFRKKIIEEIIEFANLASAFELPVSIIAESRKLSNRPINCSHEFINLITEFLPSQLVCIFLFIKKNENATIAFICVLISCDIPVKTVGQLIILLFNDFILFTPLSCYSGLTDSPLIFAVRSNIASYIILSLL